MVFYFLCVFRYPAILLRASAIKGVRFLHYPGRFGIFGDIETLSSVAKHLIRETQAWADIWSRNQGETAEF